MRTTIIGGIVALVVAVVVIATQVGGSHPARDDGVSGAPGVFRDPPFSVRLAGPLWQARTLQDVDGVQDFALVESDLPLDVRATGNPNARVAELELRVDGQSKRAVVPPCPNGLCPVSAATRFVPPLRAMPPGEHRIDIVVRDPAGVAGKGGAGEHVTTFGFSVTHVKSVPRTVEGQTISKLPAPPPTGTGVAAQQRRAALGVLSAARLGGGVAAALGSARVSVVQIGRLDAGPAGTGVTMLVTVTPPLYDVRATVPAYIPVAGPGGARFRTQMVGMHVAVLRDALIDVDLSSRRVITFEPGPGSRTLSWSPSKAPTPAGAGDED